MAPGKDGNKKDGQARRDISTRAALSCQGLQIAMPRGRLGTGERAGRHSRRSSGGDAILYHGRGKSGYASRSVSSGEDVRRTLEGMGMELRVRLIRFLRRAKSSNSTWSSFNLRVARALISWLGSCTPYVFRDFGFA